MNTVKNPEVLLFINIKLLKKKYDSKKSCDRVFLRLIHSHRQHWKKIFKQNEGCNPAYNNNFRLAAI